MDNTSESVLDEAQHAVGKELIYSENMPASPGDVFVEICDLCKYFWPDIGEEYTYRDFRPMWVEPDRHIQIQAHCNKTSGGASIGWFIVTDVVFSDDDVGVFFSHYSDLAYTIANILKTWGVSADY